MSVPIGASPSTRVSSSFSARVTIASTVVQSPGRPLRLLAPAQRSVHRRRAAAASSVAWVMTWLRFSTSMAADRSGASVFVCSARFVICTPSGEWAAICDANSSARSRSWSSSSELAHQPALVRLLGGDGAAGEHPVGGHAEPDDARQVVAHPHLGARQPEEDGGVAEGRRRRADAHVGREAQRQPTPDRGTVHRRHHRLGQRPERLGERRHPLLEPEPLDGRVVGVEHARPEVAQVDAGAEAPAGAGQDDHPDVAVCADGGAQLVQLGLHHLVDGVQPLGTVEPHERDARRPAFRW